MLIINIPNKKSNGLIFGVKKGVLLISETLFLVISLLTLLMIFYCASAFEK